MKTEQQKRDLPDYKKPPVVEVIIGIRFQPIEKLSTTHFGIFWEKIKSEYPLFDDKPPLGDESEETRFEVVHLPPLRRVFMHQANQAYVMQLQPDRFLHNWRKLKDSDEYPHFSQASSNFKHGWELFTDFAVEQGLGRPQSIKYEVTYINHFFEKPDSFPLAMAGYFPFFRWQQSGRRDQFLPDPTSVALDLRFAIPEDRGRLRLLVKHGKRKPDDSDVMQAEMMVNGPAKADASDLDEFLKLANTWIVKGFTDLTAESAHRKWDRTQ